MVVAVTILFSLDKLSNMSSHEISVTHELFRCDSGFMFELYYGFPTGHLRLEKMLLASSHSILGDASTISVVSLQAFIWGSF